MARKNYSDEFRRQAVDLYESTPGATLKGIAEDLGIGRETLANWVKALGTGSTTAPITSPRTPSGRPETPAEKLARLEAENAQLKADMAKVETEKRILVGRPSISLSVLPVHGYLLTGRPSQIHLRRAR